jgi:histidinol-phosphatase (PHP family)
VLVDLHAHTTLCNHATGTLEEYVEQAIVLGIGEFGFSEHSPWMYQNAEKLAPDFDEMPEYFHRVESVQLHFMGGTTPGRRSRISIRLGIEMDYLPGKEDLAREYARTREFDFIIGSVHHIGTWGFDQESQKALYAQRDSREVYEEYFRLVINMISSGLFDIVGHIDLVKKFGYRPRDGYRDLQESVVRALRESNMAVEVNTSGMDRPVKECYPDQGFLKLMHENKIPVTLGSDAHAPSEVGRHFTEAVAMLKAVGYREVLTYEKRRRIGVKIG